MPANIMVADIGDIRKVAGKRIDIAPIGPIPGSTPTKAKDCAGHRANLAKKHKGRHSTAVSPSLPSDELRFFNPP